MTTNATMLITISGPEITTDLAAPADAPIDELLPTFVELVGGQTYAPQGWEVGPAGRAALDGLQSLSAHGVADGGVLQLRPRAEFAAAGQVSEPASDDVELADDGLTPSGRTAGMLPVKLGLGERLGAAARAATSKPEPVIEPLARPGRTDPGTLTKPVSSTPMERWRSSWRSTDHLRQLDESIRLPRLRRSVTIAVVSPKGGVGKTTLTALLGSLFALERRDRTIAVDTNPDYGSLGRTLAPDHEVFVDDLLDLLERPDLTATGLDAQLGRANDGLMVLPAPTDPARMARLDRGAYATVIERLQTMAGLLILDCGTGLQEPAAQAAMMAADQIVLVSDAEPSTASLVAEASDLLGRVGAPLTLVVNKLPSGGGRLDVSALEARVPQARALVQIPLDPARASKVASGDFTWTEPAGGWDRALRELATVLTADWKALGLTSS